MNRKKALPILYVAIFAVSFILLSMTVVGGARAALITSTSYENALDTHYIGVTLNENGAIAASKDYNSSNNTWDHTEKQILRSVSDNFVVGKKYEDSLTVKNSGDIDEFVRVVVYRYWTKKVNGVDTKDNTKDPTLIDISFNTEESENGKWIQGPKSDNGERIILYYSKALKKGEETPSFFNSLMINKDLMNKYIVNEDGTYSFEYNGYSFKVEVQVDGVQKAHAEDAVKSAWGVSNLSITDDTLGVD